MKRILPLLALLAFAPAARSFQVVKTGEYNMPTNQTAAEQVLVLADSATVRGNIFDDLFLVANSILFDGSASNDVWLLGNEVNAHGAVSDHLRAVGNTVNISGTMRHTLAAVGAAVQVATGTVVNGSVTIVANSASVGGMLSGNVRVMAQEATFTGNCGGDLRIIANDIVVTPGATIAGDLTYTSPKELILDPKVQIGGKLIRQAADQSAAPQISMAQLAMAQMYFVLAAFIAGLFFTGYFPRFSQSAVSAAKRSPAKCALAGFLGLCLIPMLATLALATIVGIPFAVLLIAAFAIMAYIGKIVVAIFVGSFVFGPKPGFFRRAGALLLGLIVLYGLPLLPGAGTIIWFLVEFFGLGAIILALHESQRAPVLAPDLPKA